MSQFLTAYRQGEEQGWQKELLSLQTSDEGRLLFQQRDSRDAELCFQQMDIPCLTHTPLPLPGSTTSLIIACRTARAIFRPIISRARAGWRERGVSALRMCMDREERRFT